MPAALCLVRCARRGHPFPAVFQAHLSLKLSGAGAAAMPQVAKSRKWSRRHSRQQQRHTSRVADRSTERASRGTQAALHNQGSQGSPNHNLMLLTRFTSRGVVAAKASPHTYPTVCRVADALCLKPSEVVCSFGSVASQLFMCGPSRLPSWDCARAATALDGQGTISALCCDKDVLVDTAILVSAVLL